MPGPGQLTEVPSPIDHDTDVGRATAVTITPGTCAVAERTPQLAGSTHNHVGRFTSCSPAGLATIRGEGRSS